jgi:hypothetical protein
MRFTIIYKNDPNIRGHVINLLTQMGRQGMNLSQNISHPLCNIRAFWPDMPTLFNLPMNMQCEELEYIEGNFHPIRQLVIDVEVIVKTEQTIQKTNETANPDNPVQPSQS